MSNEATFSRGRERSRWAFDLAPAPAPRAIPPRSFVCGEQDGRALAEIYRVHVKRVEALLRSGFWSGGSRVPGVGRGADLDDLAQETFRRVFSPGVRAPWQRGEELALYLSAIARNVLVDFLRRRARESPCADVDALSRASVSMPEPSDEPWADRRVLGLTERFIASLQGPSRELYQHRFVDGLTQLATARAMGLSRQRIRTLESGLLDSLRRAIT